MIEDIRDFVKGLILNDWDWVAIIISLIALYVAIKSLKINIRTLNAQLRTADNTKETNDNTKETAKTKEAVHKTILYIKLSGSARRVLKNLKGIAVIKFIVHPISGIASNKNILSCFSPARLFETIPNFSEMNLTLSSKIARYPMWQVTSKSGDVTKYCDIIELERDIDDYNDLLNKLEVEIKNPERSIDYIKDTIDILVNKSIIIIEIIDLFFKEVYGPDVDIKRIFEKEINNWKSDLPDKHDYRHKKEFDYFLEMENIKQLTDFFDKIGMDKERVMPKFINSAHKLLMEISEVFNK